jgi:hypothetical protein
MAPHVSNSYLEDGNERVHMSAYDGDSEPNIE